MNKKKINNNELKSRLKVCFKNCAKGRNQLRNSVINAMDVGFTKEELLEIVDEMSTSSMKDEASLCSITVIGQALSYKGQFKKAKLTPLAPEEKEKIKNKLNQSFKKCGLARKQLRKCIVNALNAGLTKEEILAITDDLVGGLGKNEVSACAIVAVDEVLKYEEIDKLKKTIKMFAPYMDLNK